MNLIVGLGNPGEKYEDTRHNIGFMVVDRALKNLVEVSKGWTFNKDFNSFIFKSGDLIFAKPQTYMNGSGYAISKIMQFYKVKPNELWVVHDDIDLPLGKIRIKQGGGTAGHHGLESIIREIKSDAFVRFRLGVGRGMLDIHKSGKIRFAKGLVEKLVLSRFNDSEAGIMRKMVKDGARAIEIALHKGLDKAMNAFN